MLNQPHNAFASKQFKFNLIKQIKTKKQKTFTISPEQGSTPVSSPSIKRKAKANAIPSPKSNYLYYQQFCNVYSLNYHLLQQIEAVTQEKKQLEKRLDSLEQCKRIHEEKLEWNFEIEGLKTKRFRRTATEIERKFKCPAPECGKSYGSEGSLKQHLKLKHSDKYDEYVSKSESNCLDEEEEESHTSEAAKAHTESKRRIGKRRLDS